MKKNRFFMFSFFTLMAVFLGVNPLYASQENEEIAQHIAVLFRSARGVVSDSQELINDPNKGDKGLNADKFMQLVRDKYKQIAKQDLNLDPNTKEGRFMVIIVKGIRSVVNKAQPLINKEGVGFKGFLPAGFAKQVADYFKALSDESAFIKLTAPHQYVRNRSNQPDDWEANIIENKFRASGWPKGQAFSEMANYKGEQMFRFIEPEYYTQSCLNCHGGPKGERDITGGKKEGASIGEVGGALSVIIKP